MRLGSGRVNATFLSATTEASLKRLCGLFDANVLHAYGMDSPFVLENLRLTSSIHLTLFHPGVRDQKVPRSQIRPRGAVGHLWGQHDERGLWVEGALLSYHESS